MSRRRTFPLPLPIREGGFGLTGADDLFELGDDFGRREPVGGNFDRILGFDQGADGAGAVALVAEVLGVKDLVEGHAFAAADQVAIAPLGSLDLRRR